MRVFNIKGMLYRAYTLQQALGMDLIGKNQ